MQDSQGNWFTYDVTLPKPFRWWLRRVTQRLRPEPVRAHRRGDYVAIGRNHPPRILSARELKQVMRSRKAFHQMVKGMFE